MELTMCYNKDAVFLGILLYSIGALLLWALSAWRARKNDLDGGVR